MKYRRKGTVEAVRWFKSEDHPDSFVLPKLTTIKLPDCFRFDCASVLEDHGYIPSPHGSYRICPGDWIITEGGKSYPVKDADFKRDYEPAEEKR